MRVRWKQGGGQIFMSLHVPDLRWALRTDKDGGAGRQGGVGTGSQMARSQAESGACSRPCTSLGPEHMLGQSIFHPGISLINPLDPQLCPDRASLSPVPQSVPFSLHCISWQMQSEVLSPTWSSNPAGQGH